MTVHCEYLTGCLVQPRATCIGEFLHTMSALEVIQLEHGEPIKLQISLEKPEEKSDDSAAVTASSSAESKSAQVAKPSASASNGDKREITCKLTLKLQLFRKLELEEVRVQENIVDCPMLTQGLTE